MIERPDLDGANRNEAPAVFLSYDEQWGNVSQVEDPAGGVCIFDYEATPSRGRRRSRDVRVQSPVPAGDDQRGRPGHPYNGAWPAIRRPDGSVVRP